MAGTRRLQVASGGTYSQTDADFIDWPTYNAGTTIGSAKFWVPRRVVGCVLTNSSYKIYATLGNWTTRGKTNLVLIQRYYTTNTALWSATCALDFTSNDASIRWQGGLIVNNQTNTVTTNPYMVRVTNSFSLPPNCVDGTISMQLGRASTADSGAVVTPTNTVWWAGAEGYLY